LPVVFFFVGDVKSLLAFIGKERNEFRYDKEKNGVLPAFPLQIMFIDIP
jgi:hypothetical protein